MKKSFLLFGIFLLICVNFSCEKEQEINSPIEQKNGEHENIYNEGAKGSQSSCNIISPSSINTTTSAICLNNYETFTYQSNFNNPSVSWIIPNVPGLTVVGPTNTPSITLYFASNFTGATIQANGVSGTLHCYEPENIVVKTSGCSGNNCNSPSDFDFESYYICQQNKGFIYDIYGGLNPSTISQIYVQLQTCGTFTNNSGTLQGNSSGYITPSNVQLPLLFNGCSQPHQDCIPGTSYNVILTYYFNNGCPSFPLTKNFQFDYIP
jgi:hypothetical protein